MINSRLLQKTLEAGSEVIEELREKHRIDGQDLTLYNAGLQDGETRFGLFARDLFLSAFMLGDSGFLSDVVKFACLTQGEKRDPRTGEELGKVIHEYEHVTLRGRETRYNASDTTQFTLIGLAKLLDNGNRWFVTECSDSIRGALSYLFNHIEEGIFWEDPSHCGAERYALRSTYWKDDRLPGREHPHYPVAYSLVQAQTVAALREGAKLAGVIKCGYSQDQLLDMADKLVVSFLSTLWTKENDFPAIAKDDQGLIPGISSDGIHALAYLEPEDLPKRKLESIMENAESLLTPYGFRTYGPNQPDYSPHSYHLGSVWPFEQYFIARAGRKFDRNWLIDIAGKSLEALDGYGFYELFGWEEGKLRPLGCDRQLWSACLPAGLNRITG